jgi:hypothetical protein
MESQAERRDDGVLRELVARCEQVLTPYGFTIDGRGEFAHCRWLRFHAPAAPQSEYVVLVAHDRNERALVVDVGISEKHPAVHTPLRKWVHRYQPPAPPGEGMQALTRDLGALIHAVAA